MKKYKSNKGVTQHFFCPDPVTLDKSSEWGEGNLQNFPNGVFLQIQNGIISHGVQPNADKTAPLGWTSKGNNLYEKKHVFAEQLGINPVVLMTADGEMTYDNSTNNGWILYNIGSKGFANPGDTWFVTNEKFQKLYTELEQEYTIEELNNLLKSGKVWYEGKNNEKVYSGSLEVIETINESTLTEQSTKGFISGNKFKSHDGHLILKIRLTFRGFDIPAIAIKCTNGYILLTKN